MGRRRAEAPQVYHSGRASQYAAAVYQKKFSEASLACSISRKGNCWDKAVVETLPGGLKTERIHRCVLSTGRNAELTMHAYIKLFYDIRRHHSCLNHKSPPEHDKAPLKGR